MPACRHGRRNVKDVDFDDKAWVIRYLVVDAVTGTRKVSTPSVSTLDGSDDPPLKASLRQWLRHE